MKSILFSALGASAIIFATTVGHAQTKPNIGPTIMLTSKQIDIVANEFQSEPAFKDGGYEGKLGYWISSLFKMDWPVKNEDVRKTLDIDPEQDTDGDGTPDIDDEDIDGDGKPNYKDSDIDGDGINNKKDGSPYDSTKSVVASDRDGDGVPDLVDSFPDDPNSMFTSSILQGNQKRLSRSMWR
ncbi:MAG: hypothetical protein L3J32_01700 [Rhizobiaceae bacterium]|nr:hypothetical protein [Rhizobiaceae bacterium]